MTPNKRFHLLVVDDDSLIIESLKLTLPSNWRMTSLQDFVRLDPSMLIHAAFVDMHLTGNINNAEGPEVINKISKANPQIDIIAMSGDLSLDLMEKCLKNGAQKFLAKPLNPEEVILTLEKIEAMWMMRHLESRGGHNLYRWIGNSRESQDVKKHLASMRGEAGPILISGETGTGKEVAFRILNQQEDARPFISVNIASISENLFESEMFGHVRGAFTGADSIKVGLAEAAHGGDLFLDEIEALAPTQQVKLLRFLETGEVRKVGSKESINVQTRVICASNQNLHDLVKQGKFREDLLFRISGKNINLPPLSQRTEDIPDLVEFFLSQQKPKRNKTLSAEALAELKKYNWPGNVRELKRICEQLALTSPLPIIRDVDTKSILSPQTTLSTNNVDYSRGLSALVEDFEKQIISKCLYQLEDIDKTAELLKMSRSNIYKKIKDYQIDIKN
jgi:DNA-binding NtrC family response regulator